MAVTRFDLASEWRLATPIERVWAELSTPENWPQWWRAVRKVDLLDDGDPATGVGARRMFTWGTALPYTVSFEMTATRVEPMSVLEGRARGELDGTGRWTLRSHDDGTVVRYDWMVDITRPWQVAMAPVLRPVFAWNHNVVMGWGHEDLKARLLEDGPLMVAGPFSEIIDLLSLVPEGNEEAVDAVRMHDRQLTKPPGSLGRLETLVEWLARWQGKPNPTFENPMVAIFAGNHGVTDQGVSAYPREVTAQMVANFTAGGAAISKICALHEINLRVFELALELPTGDITQTAAMDDKMCAATIAYGMEAIAGKPDCLAIGEMGIGNTTVAAAIYAALFGGTGANWVGRGTGVDDAGLARKADAVDRALALHQGALGDPLAILARLGGREIAAMLGALVAARHQKVPVVVDGFVATSAAAIACAVNPAAIEHCIFAHVSAETAHARALAAMGVTPLLDLGMRLGEGSGAALGMVLAKTALHLHTHMATFAGAGVSDRD